MEEFELKGIWWLPNNENNYIHGILRFIPEDGAYLELMDQLLDYKTYEVDIILGRSADGKNITLYKCFELKKTLISSGFLTSKVFANIVFKGVHFEKEEDIIFTELSCHYSNLDEWAWMNGISLEYTGDNKIEIKYEYPPVVSVNISEEYTIEIYVITQTPSYSIVQKEASIVQKVYVKLINNKLNSFDEHREKLDHMQNFISLGVGVPVRNINLIGKTEENKEELQGNIIYPKVTIYLISKVLSSSYKQVLPPHMLFSFRAIEEEFHKIIKSWFDMKKTLSPIFDLYFGIIYNSGMYLEQRFLSLVQAIESYHRRTRINNEIDPSKHGERIDNIIQSVDDDYKSWLKGRLSYSNEPTLRTRLIELVRECDSLLKLPSSRKKKSFISKVCDTRNYLTHYDVALSHRVAKEIELLNIITMLKIIIEYNLLVDIGFDKDKTNKLLKEKYKKYELFN